jgi:hypothetical protein
MIELIVLGVASCVLGFSGAKVLDHGLDPARRRDSREDTPFI